VPRKILLPVVDMPSTAGKLFIGCSPKTVVTDLNVYSRCLTCQNLLSFRRMMSICTF
jgi:hypothetical protein